MIRVNENAFSLIICIFALFIISSLILQISNLLIDSSKILNLKSKYHKFTNDEVSFMFEALSRGIKNETSQIITENKASILTLKNNTEENSFYPLISNSLIGDFYWRRALHKTTRVEFCKQENSPCEIGTYYIDKNLRTYEKEVKINELIIKISEVSNVVTFAGSLDIEFLKLEFSEDDTEISSDLKLIISSFGRLKIRQFVLPRDILIKRGISLTIILNSSTSIELSSLHHHNNCINKDSYLTFLINSPLIIKEGELIFNNDYNNCIGEISPDWFPTSKIIGYLNVGGDVW